MQTAKKQNLARAGFVETNIQDFLGLTPEESTYIEMKVALCGKLKELRRKRRLTQTQLAKALKSSQSRVAKMEAGDASVSVDLVVKSLLAIGASREDIAKAITA